MPKKFDSDSSERKFSPQSELGFAYRLGIEVISGILVGLILGYGIDHIFAISPWGLITMVILGAAAGILNIFRLIGLWGNPPSQSLPCKPKEPGEKQDG